VKGGVQHASGSGGDRIRTVTRPALASSQVVFTGPGTLYALAVTVDGALAGAPTRYYLQVIDAASAASVATFTFVDSTSPPTQPAANLVAPIAVAEFMHTAGTDDNLSIFIALGGVRVLLGVVVLLSTSSTAVTLVAGSNIAVPLAQVVTP
jgi:hypothetical protein